MTLRQTLFPVMDVDFFKLSCNQTICSTTFDVNMSEIYRGEPTAELPIVVISNRFFAYFTPIIVIVGLAGNLMSLCVLLSKKLRNMSASRYLAALSMADIATLLFYVLSEWLKRGLKHIHPGYTITFFDREGICQLWLYFNYVSRFVSAWLVVCFTIERFIGVCMPFRRRLVGSLKETMRIIFAVIACSFVLLIYKPVMSEVRTIRGRSACTSKEEYIFKSFVLDAVYGLLITLVPFVIITSLNTLIIHRLVLRTRRIKNIIQTEETSIRLEFTLILVVISFFFVAFDLPFFIAWFRFFLLSAASYKYNTIATSHEYWTGVLQITRTVFYMNYCINFFLYTITGGYFRKELKALFTIDKMRRIDEHIAMLKTASNNTHETRSTGHS